MTESTVRYQRIITTTYGEDGLERPKQARLNTGLYTSGLPMGSRWSGFRDDNYGETEKESKNEYLRILVCDGVDEDLITTRSQKIIHDMIDRVNAHLEFDFMTIETVTEVTTATKEQMPVGSFLRIDGAHSHRFMDGLSYSEQGMPVTDGVYTMRLTDDDGSMIEVIAELDLLSYSPPELTITINYDAPSVLKKQAIEDKLVLLPLSLIGRIQGVVEHNLKTVGIDIENPILDCQFHSMNESRSECAPDIVEMVRAEKMKHR